MLVEQACSVVEARRAAYSRGVPPHRPWPGYNLGERLCTCACAAPGMCLLMASVWRCVGLVMCCDSELLGRRAAEVAQFRSRAARFVTYVYRESRGGRGSLK